MRSIRQGRDQSAVLGVIPRLIALLLALASTLLRLAIFQDRQGLLAEFYARNTAFSVPPRGRRRHALPRPLLEPKRFYQREKAVER